MPYINKYRKNYVAKTSISDDINIQKTLQIAFRKKLLSSYTSLVVFKIIYIFNDKSWKNCVSY